MPLYRGLLVSTQRNSERSGSSEMQFVLANKLNIEDNLFSIRLTRISGLITVKLDPSLDSHQLIRDLIALEKEEPYFMHCLKIRPVDTILEADIGKTVESIKGLGIQREGSFRISISKRHTPISSMDLITPLAKLFPDNPVDLEKPNWEIWIEIVADTLGYAIIEPELVFSTDLAYVEEDDNIPNWFLE